MGKRNHYMRFTRSLQWRMISGILGKKKKQKIYGVHKSYFWPVPLIFICMS